MKLKHLLCSIGLGLFAATSAGLGVFALQKNETVAAHAESDTWMVNISLGAGDITGYDGFDPNSMWVQTYTNGVGNGNWFHMYPIKTGSKYYQVNATFSDDYSYDTVQFKFTQSGVEKYSTSYRLVDTSSKESHYKQIYSSFSGWEGDNWKFSLNLTYNVYVKYAGNNYYFTEDVANERFVITDFVCDGSDYYTLNYRSSWDFAQATLTTSAATNMSYISTAWCSMKAGTYDLFLKNNNNDNGVIEIKKHGTESSYIYYVSQSDDDDYGLYAYSFGYNNHLGSWPGTLVSESTFDDGCEILDICDGFKFQNQAHKVFKLAMTIGYPADDHIIFSNNGSTQSGNLLLKAGAAYWKGTAAESYNANAGVALDLFCDLKVALKNAIRYGPLNLTKSVCGVDKDTAASLYNRYDALSAEDKAEYIDCSYIKTYTGVGAYTAYTSCDKIFEQLGIIGEVIPASPSRMTGDALANSTSTAIIVVICVCVLSAAGFTTLAIFKKRKQH